MGALRHGRHAGAAIAVAGFLLGGVDIHTQGRDLVVPLFLLGMGSGLSFMPLITQVINAAPRVLVGRVTALTSALQQVVLALTVASLSTYLTSRPSYIGAQHLITQITQAQAAAAKAGHATATAATMAHTALPAPVATLFSQAFGDTFAVIAIMAIVAVVLALGVRRRTSAQYTVEATAEPAGVPVVHLLAG